MGQELGLGFHFSGLEVMENSAHKSDLPSFQSSVINFPSDSLSVKRLRLVFPSLFDNGSALSNGVSAFFSPEPGAKHLQDLNDIINYERTVAEFGFYDEVDPFPSDTLDERCKQVRDEARDGLEMLYLQFKLADSPESARFLISHVEEQARQQAAKTKGHLRYPR